MEEENHFHQLQFNPAIPSNDVDAIDVSKDEKHQPHSTKSVLANNEEIRNRQSSEPDPIISNGTRRELIKDVATVTAIIEKIMANKNYFNLLNERNNISSISITSKQEPLELLSKDIIVSEENMDIKKNLIKEIATAVKIIDQIISKKINTSNPILERTISTNKKIITKKVRKIIATAIVSPNLIALEKSIKELLSRQSIFTNFKA